MPRSDYPQLTAMGVQHPLQIDRYQVNGISNFDILRIIYERGEGSFLPSTRTYKFPRVQRNLPRGGDDTQSESVLESHPDLRKAVDELDALLATKEHKECVAETVLQELESLEEEIAARSAYVRELVKKL